MAPRILVPAIPIVVASAVFLAGCGGVRQMPKPSGLVYPEGTISGIMNQPITPDTPRVIGTVSGFAAHPALPAGLTLNTTTGIISGTPTAVSPSALYTVTAWNSAGSTSTTLRIFVNEAAATAISYPQTIIRGYVGEPIPDDTPTANGVVEKYDWSGSFVAGLTVDPSTGTISGTPTEPQELSTFTIFAVVPTGYVETTVQIAVAEPLASGVPPSAPTGLQYPQTSITTWAGREITPDIPATAATITSYTVSPALPPGLTISPSTGVIFGTPTLAIPQADYTITGSNAAGNVSTTISLTVNEKPIILAQLGISGSDLQFTGSRVLSEGGGLWMLWNYSSGALIASGDAVHGYRSLGNYYSPAPAQMAGSTIAIGVPGGIEVRSSVDGQLLGVIVSPGYQIDPSTNKPEEEDQWELASDGSYIAVGTTSGLYAFAPNGQLLCFEPGNYIQISGSGLNEDIFAGPGQIQVADGWGGPNAIETFSVPGGVSSVSAPFQGTFYTWFTDGKSFLTQTGYFDSSGQPANPAPGSTVRVYSSDGAEEASMPLPFFYAMGGWGKWIWLWGYSDATGPITYVYPIGSIFPVLTDSTPGYAYDESSGSALAVFPGGTNNVGIIDLSGSQPVETEYTLHPSNEFGYYWPYPLGPFAAVSANQWVARMGVADTFGGVILDGPSLAAANLRYIGNGGMTSIAGSANTVAIATAGGQVSWFDPTDGVAEGSLNLTSGEVELSSDGSLMGAATALGETLNFYTMPDGEQTQSFSYPPNYSFNFALSGSGSTLASTQTYMGSDETAYYTLTVTPVSNSSTILSTTNFGNVPAVISPDGTLVAATNIANDGSGNYTTVIYKNGKTQASVPGMAVGWIDNSRLIVETMDGPNPSGTTIYSPTGAVIGTPPLPMIGAFQTVSPDVIYVSGDNAMYSVTSGQKTWSSPYAADTDQGNYGPGAVAGSHVVFESEGKVISVPF